MNVLEARDPPGELTLDPFSYVPDMASKIGGLGGGAHSPDGDYAFHTPYVEVAEGVAHFTTHFEKLTATAGTLNLRVHMLSSDSPHARLATSERVALNRLVLLGGHYELRFEAFHGMTYALYAGIVGETDARAESVRVVLDRPANPDERREIAAEARDTLYGREAAITGHIVSVAAPTLAVPVTQPATIGQMREPTAAKWIADAHLKERSLLEQWRTSFLLQALQSYGLMEQGARGVGLGRITGPVPAVLAAHRVKVDVLYPLEGGEADVDVVRAALCDDRICPSSIFDEHLQIGSVSLDPLAPSIVNYDFLWTDGACDQFGSAGAGASFIEAAMACVRPGGLAVHLVEYDADGEGAGRAFERSHVERMCLVLISRGHDVAEFRIDSRGVLRNERGLSACAIVCRKASLKT